MNKSFLEIIKISNEEGLFPRFSSNGKLLTPPLIDKLSKYKFLAAIDFSSERDVFDQIRGKKGDYDIVLQNLLYLVEKARIDSGVNVEIVDITHFLSKNNINRSLKKMRQLFSPNLPQNIRFLSRKFHNFCGHLEKDKKSDNYKLCPYPWTFFTVTWDGNAVACCRDTKAQTILGNIFEQSVFDIWRGEKYKLFRQKLIQKRPQDIAACASCDLPWSAGDNRWNIKYISSSLLRR
jgi:radical SAM protein with 4Fe4S-binding SPASM domain